MVASSPIVPAPGNLELVRQFVNTLDIEAGTDRLSNPEDALRWAAGQGVDLDTTPRDLDRLRDLRESLRVALLANHGGNALPPRAVDALNSASARAPLVVHFEPDGTRLTTSSTGVNCIYGRLLAAIAAAMSDHTWTRLKACASDACQWGFYDTSRSRTGQWCSMSICGNRAKQARYRDATARRHVATTHDTTADL